MDKRLVNTLLGIFHSDDDPKRVSYSGGLFRFHERYNVGRRRGASLYFNAKDKTEIREILAGELGIDAEKTRPEDWAALGRDTSLELARNEKFARTAVGEGRLQVKALRGQFLSVCGGRWMLPDRCDLGVDLSCVLGSFVPHGAVLLVENRQTFLEIWNIGHGLLDEVSALNPLVVFRGDAGGGAQVQAANWLIAGLNLPVYAFVDYDPAGMVIAASLPRLDGVIAPEVGILMDLLNKHGLSDRFMAQIGQARHILEHLLPRHPVLRSTSEVIMASGKALPQEHFHQDT